MRSASRAFAEGDGWRDDWRSLRGVAADGGPGVESISLQREVMSNSAADTWRRWPRHAQRVRGTLEPLGQAGKEGAARSELRIADTNPRAVADLVNLVEHVEEVETQL